MTTNDIDAIRKQANAATPGPWRAHTMYPHTVWQGPEDDDDPGIISTTLSREVVADAEFIAAARTLVPALCDEIEQLRARVAEMEEEDDAHCDQLHAENGRLTDELEKVRGQLIAARGIADRFGDRIAGGEVAR